MSTLTDASVRSAVTYLDSWLCFRQRYLRVPGVQAALLYGDEIVLSGAYGSADVERDVPLTTDHLFRIASHSKTFTATALLQLERAGRLRLDDRLGDLLPALAGAPVAAITVRELLNHSGGLIRDGLDSDHWQLTHPFPDEAALLEVAAAAEVLEPNERFKYSNIGYGLLGLVIEAVSGTPYNAYVSAEIVDRLGLRHTGPELDPDRIQEYAAGYSALSYAPERVPIEHVDTAALAAATGFFSTAEDLCRYAAAHFPGDDRLLDDAGKRRMQHGWWPVEGVPDGRYGLGFAEIRAGERTLLGHGGGYPGHITRTLFDPAERLAVAVLTNAIDGPAEELATTVVKLLDLAAEASEPAPPGSERFRVRLANLWGVRDVALLGGRLLLLDPTAGDPTATPSQLVAESDSTLRVTDGPGYGAVGETMEFTFGPEGEVSSVSGPGGMTCWPLDTYRLPAAVRAPQPAAVRAPQPAARQE